MKVPAKLSPGLAPVSKLHGASGAASIPAIVFPIHFTTWYTTAALTAGSQNITAVYDGTADIFKSASKELTQAHLTAD